MKRIVYVILLLLFLIAPIGRLWGNITNDYSDEASRKALKCAHEILKISFYPASIGIADSIYSNNWFGPVYEYAPELASTMDKYWVAHDKEDQSPIYSENIVLSLNQDQQYVSNCEYMAKFFCAIL